MDTCTATLRAPGSHTAPAFPQPPEGLMKVPQNRVFARMDDPWGVTAAMEDLGRSGFDRDKVWVLSGPEGADRLDVSGRHHGLKGRLYRMMERLGDEWELLVGTVDHLAAGGLIITVPADEDAMAGAARILHRHGGHDMVHFGKWHWERLGR
jgi:hypothetical protein